METGVKKTKRDQSDQIAGNDGGDDDNDNDDWVALESRCNEDNISCKAEGISSALSWTPSASIDRSSATKQVITNITALVEALGYRFNVSERGREGAPGTEKVRISLRPQLLSDITESKKERKREMGGTPLNRFRRKVLFTSEDAAAPLWGSLQCAPAERLNHDIPVNFWRGRSTKDRETTPETHRLKLLCGEHFTSEETARFANT